MVSARLNSIIRLTQIGVAFIPVAIGLIAGLNDATNFSGTVKSLVEPLITMQGVQAQHWRSLPEFLAPFIYTLLFTSETLVGVLALIGAVGMIKNFRAPAAQFESEKLWVYIACGVGVIVWGLGFFEGADWFLAWENNAFATFQQGILMYVNEMIVTFLYLKLTKDNI